MFEKLRVFWRYVRRLTGDDAYEQYLKHFAENHADQEPQKTRSFRLHDKLFLKSGKIKNGKALNVVAK
jgi:uncharacterized short protein YbdD (DUF466 family)